MTIEEACKIVYPLRNAGEGQPLAPTALLADDTQWQCTICGRIGAVGRCCGIETRRPLNDAARKEEQRIKSANITGQEHESPAPSPEPAPAPAKQFGEELFQMAVSDMRQRLGPM